MICLLVGLMAASGLARQNAVDPITGTWTGDWGPNARQRNQVVLELKFDGKVLTGTVNTGPNSIPIAKATFDPKTLAVHMEVDAKGTDLSNVHYVVDGKIDKNTMSGSWIRENGKGDFKLTKN